MEATETQEADLNIFTETILADKEKGDEIINKVRQAVYDEFDRAVIEGTATKQEAETQKTHTETVVELSREAVKILREEGIEVSEAQERSIIIKCYLHDVQKIVPERERIKFDQQLAHLRREREYTEQQIAQAEASGKTREANSLRRQRNKTTKKIEELSHPDLQEYSFESTKHSGEFSSDTRLLRHGEDAVGWSAQLLEDLGFSNNYIEEAKADIISHMPMPYVKGVLREVAKTSKADNPTMPKNLEDGSYPEPKSLEGAVLLAADFASSFVMAGEDLDKDPTGGGFDKYLAINLNVYREQGISWGIDTAYGGPFEEGSSAKSVYDNVQRLKHPPQRDTRGIAPEIETILGKRMGDKAMDKISGFRQEVENGMKIDEDESEIQINSLRDLTVWQRVKQVSPSGESIDFEVPDTKKSMDRYYKAIKIYRQRKGLNPDNILDR